MYTIATLLCFASVWSLFSSAQKVEFEKRHLTLALAKNGKIAKGISVALYLGSTLLFCSLLGYGTGILGSIILWMIFASVVVLFAPFPTLRFVHLILMVGVLILLELLSYFIS